MSYRQVMDDAIGDAPVSTVDVDGVITRQRRAWRVRRWGACAAGAVAVLVVTATAAQVLPGRTLTQPADERRITTVPGTPEDLARLDNAVFAAFERAVPGMRWQSPDWGHFEGGENTLVGYSGRGGFLVDGVMAYAMVQVERHGARRAGGLRCDQRDNTCQETSGPHGERVRVRAVPRTDTSGEQMPGNGRQQVEVLRPADDTLVTVSLDARGGPWVLTREQQTAMALDPALALAPLPPGVVVTPPPPSASPKPPEVADPAQRKRIDNAVFASLRRHAPGVMGDDGVPAPADLATVWTDAGGDNTADMYWGQGRIMLNGGAGNFTLNMHREDPGFGSGLTCGKPTSSYACTAGTGPHGERYRTVTITTRTSSTPATTSADRFVSVLREDGRVLWVSLSADPPSGKFPLTAAQQQAVAFDRTIDLPGR